MSVWMAMSRRSLRGRRWFVRVRTSMQSLRTGSGTLRRTCHAPYREIASLTGTTYIAVEDGAPSAVRDSIAKVYEDKRLLASTTETDDIILTVPYRDASGLGLVTTLVGVEFANAVDREISCGIACPQAHIAHTFDRSDTHHAFRNTNSPICAQAAPVRVGGVLKGVMGVDLTLTDLLESISQYTSTIDNSYAFVADAQGRVLLHPNLPEPQHWLSDPVFLHVDELER